MSETQAVVVAQRPAEVERFMPVMSMSQAVERRQVIVDAVAKLMHSDEDFGVIPGTKKPTLYQPGADKLNNLFGLVPRFDTMEQAEDWTGRDHNGEPFFYYRVKCRLLRGDFVMGEGEGSCNSWESKYRYRKTERTCPQCNKETIIKGKAEYGGGWLCFAKRGGCGAKYKDGDQAIEGQVVGQKPNPDVAEVVNTVLKMAMKRAKIAATLNATSAHEFFTQDVEDMPGSFPQEPTETQAEVLKRKVAEFSGPAEKAETAKPNGKDTVATFKAMLAKFSELKARVGGELYYRILGGEGFTHANEIPSLQVGRRVYREIEMAAADPAPAFQATDADLPQEIGGTE